MIERSEIDAMPFWKHFIYATLALLSLPILIILLPIAYLFTAVTGR